MIVRISTEGQFEVEDSSVDKLNELDNACVEAVEGGDEDAFHRTYDEMLELVRSHGRGLSDDDLHESALILPPPDLTFEGAGEQFTGEGLIPD
ncbi:MAG: hypothetical protein ABIO51_01360 [Solirubrobacteraceae bacterium]